MENKTTFLGVVEQAGANVKKSLGRKLKKGESVKGRMVCCSECGYKFFLSEENEHWYKDNGMEPPKKCFVCRQAAKGNKVVPVGYRRNEV